MVAKMAASFNENGCIHQISCHNMLLLVLGGLKMIILERKRYKQNVHAILSWLNITNIFQGPENHIKCVKF